MFGLNRIIPVEPNINFLGLRRNFLIFSILAILISIGLLSIKGLNLGIDFKGGTLIEVSTKNTSIGELREILSSSYSDVSLQEFGNENIILIRLQNKSNQESIETVNSVKNLIQDKVVEFRRSEFVGPTISSELLFRGFQAVSFALIAILIYIWLRFEWQFGFGAVVALTHDVLFTLGLLSILNVEFSLATIAAILTIAGYSINDTVVIFDRVRENLRKYKKCKKICEHGANQGNSKPFGTPADWPRCVPFGSQNSAQEGSDPEDCRSVHSEPSWGILEHLGVSWSHPGVSWSHLGDIVGHLGGILHLGAF